MMSCLAACNNGSRQELPADSGLLPASEMVHNPRSAQGTDPEALDRMPVLSFRDTVYDFGTIHEGEDVIHEFEFTNTGKTPLIISGVHASCGCTAGDYPRDPVLPGAGGSVKVTFRSTGKSGHEEKSVAIYANTLRATHALYIKVDIAARN